MQSNNERFKRLISNIALKIEFLQKENKHKTPTLNDVHDSFLEYFRDFAKNKDDLREIIVKHLKIMQETKNSDIALLVKRILNDFKTSK